MKKSLELAVLALRGFFIIFYLLTGTTVQSKDDINTQLLCNEDAHICDRRYNEVTYMMSHNAQSSESNWFFALLPRSNINNQNRILEIQLKDGVRAMKMPVHTFGHQTHVCHGMGHWVKGIIKNRTCSKLSLGNSICGDWIDELDPCSIDPSSRTLVNVLKTLRRFLLNNPREILTLFLEDDANDLKAIQRSFETTQLTSYMHSQPKDQAWPTLRKMIEDNRRLVVFVNRSIEQKEGEIDLFPLLNPTSYFVWSSSFHFNSPEELSQDTPDSSNLKELSLLNRNLPPANRLWLLQHFVTPAIAGNENAALYVNQAAIIEQRIEKYMKQIGTAPNFVSVDFYQLPLHAPGADEVVQRLNHKRMRSLASEPTKKK